MYNTTMNGSGASYTNFQISPPKHAIVLTNKGKEEESARPQYLILGAFARTPKIHFEKVQLGHSKSRSLIVRNPSTQDIRFEFLKMPTDAFELSCSTSNLIFAQDQLVIDIKWTPTEAGRSFEALCCRSDLSGVRLTVHLLGEAEPAKWKPNSMVGLGRRAISSCSKPAVTRNVSFLGEKNIQILGNGGSTSSPSRRDTYSVPPTPGKCILDFSKAISQIQLDWGDDDDESKENVEKFQSISQTQHSLRNKNDDNGFSSETYHGHSQQENQSQIHNYQAYELHEEDQAFYALQDQNLTVEFETNPGSLFMKSNTNFNSIEYSKKSNDNGEREVSESLEHKFSLFDLSGDCVYLDNKLLQETQAQTKILLNKLRQTLNPQNK